ncbi:MAG: CHAD domain-containing protein [Bryobacteraceae bacterium]|jgi:CHAD domain-containing protein|nr:CHAD domain-containing protein [Bryobacteraceae bacterium]
MPGLSVSMSIAAFAKQQISARLGRLVFEIHNVAKSAEAEAVHDLRVAVRRLSQSLAVFGSLLPSGPLKKARKRLKRLRRAAGAVRDCDIALALLAEEGVPAEDALCLRLRKERQEAERGLVEEIRRWTASNVSEKWRVALQLDQT